MSDSHRRPLVGGNWKMHLLSEDARSYCERFGEGGTAATEVVLFPSFPLLPVVRDALEGGAVALGGQDLHPESQGAHTGDVSGPQLADAGCVWALCGHSERRADHGEDDELVGLKARAARSHGLRPLICVGESREERRAGRTFEVLERQLRAALSAEPGESFDLAYEPVWAIGTGETATPEIAQDAHAFIRSLLEELGGESLAARRILYGGSVNPGNAATLFAQPDLDGFLVGGASLDPAKFLAIIHACDLQ